MGNDTNTTHKLFTSRAQISANVYIGESGRMFYHEDTGELRLSDGKTPGGLPILFRGNASTDFSSITGLPTTLAGYGITDGITNAGNVVSWEAGPNASLPPPGIIGRFYYAIDTHSLYYDNGVSWDLVEPALTGDVTSVAGNTYTTLATVNSDTGTFGNASYIPIVTVNNKGLVTAISTVEATGGSGSSSITLIGDATGTGTTGANTTVTFNTVNADVGMFGDSGNIAQFTVDAKGLITSAANIAISIPSGNITLIGDATGTGTTGANTTVTLNTVNSDVGTFGNTSYIPSITVDAKGLVTAVSAIQASAGVSVTYQMAMIAASLRV